MINTKVDFPGKVPVLELGSLPIKKTGLRAFMNLSSLSRGLIGVRRVGEKSPQISSQRVIYFSFILTNIYI